MLDDESAFCPESVASGLLLALAVLLLLLSLLPPWLPPSPKTADKALALRSVDTGRYGLIRSEALLILELNYHHTPHLRRRRDVAMANRA